MNNQEIIGMFSAHTAAKDMPYGSNMTISASLVIEMVKRIVELEKVLELVKKDLLMRAEEDEDGIKVVDLSSSIWIKIKEALKEPKL